MFEIDKSGNIFHTRGDTADFDIDLSLDGEPLENYEALFSVKRNYDSHDYLYQVPVVEGHVHIPHSMTQSLPYGNFFYDIQVRIEDEADEEGRIVTIGPSIYHLKPDVTR